MTPMQSVRRMLEQWLPIVGPEQSEALAAALLSHTLEQRADERRLLCEQPTMYEAAWQSSRERTA